MRVRDGESLDGIILGKGGVHHKVDGADPRPEPEIVVQMAVVEVGGEPALVRGGGDDGDDGDDEGVDVVAQRERQEGEGRAEAPHRLHPPNPESAASSFVVELARSPNPSAPDLPAPEQPPWRRPST